MHLKTASLYAAISSTKSSNDGYRNYKDGDVIIGGLLDIHYYATSDQCTELFTTGLGYAEATIFTIEKINKNSAIAILRFSFRIIFILIRYVATIAMRAFQ